MAVMSQREKGKTNMLNAQRWVQSQRQQKKITSLEIKKEKNINIYRQQQADL